MLKQENTKSRKPRRDELVDSACTSYWYETVRCSLRLTSPYAMERRLEPAVFQRRKDSDDSPHNKWLYYRNGKHSPRKGMVEHVSVLVPESDAALDHVFWKVSRESGAISEKADGWLGKLDAAINPWFFRTNPESGTSERRSATPFVLKRLGARLDLDGIAALTIIIRESVEVGKSKLAMEATEQLYFLLLRISVLGKEPLRCVVDKIFEICKARVFPKVRHKGYCYCVSEVNFQALSRLLSLGYQNHSAYPRIRNKPQIDYIDDVILGYAQGVAVYFSFHAPKRPVDSTGRYQKDENQYRLQIFRWNRNFRKYLNIDEHCDYSEQFSKLFPDLSGIEFCDPRRLTKNVLLP